MLFNLTIKSIEHYGPNAAGILTAYGILLENALSEANVSDEVMEGIECRMNEIIDEMFSEPYNNIRPFKLAG